MTFGLTPVTPFPQATSEGFPQGIQWQVNGNDLGDRNVQTVDIIGGTGAATREGDKVTITLGDGDGPGGGSTIDVGNILSPGGLINVTAADREAIAFSSFQQARSGDTPIQLVVQPYPYLSNPNGGANIDIVNIGWAPWWLNIAATPSDFSTLDLGATYSATYTLPTGNNLSATPQDYVLFPVLRRLESDPGAEGGVYFAEFGGAPISALGREFSSADIPYFTLQFSDPNWQIVVTVPGSNRSFWSSTAALQVTRFMLMQAARFTEF